MKNEIIKCLFERLVWRNHKSGYSIFTVRPIMNTEIIADKMKNGVITCRGTIPSYQKNTPLSIEGFWASSEYGWNLEVSEIIEQSMGKIYTIDFLLSIDGIGPVTANRFVNTLGNDIFKVCAADNAVEKIAKELFITESMASRIVESVMASTTKRELMSYLLDKGGNMNNVNRLVKLYGSKALETIKKNPYKISDVSGLSLYCCDKIAEDVGFPLNSFDRIESYVSFALKKRTTSGDVYSEEKDVYPFVTKASEQVFKNGLSYSTITSIISYNENIIVEKDTLNRIYTKCMYKAERNMVKQVSRLMKNSRKTIFDDSFREYAESVAGFEFAPEQRGAFNLLKQTGIGILTGGPGTGKTTTVKGIIDAFKKMYPEKVIKLCAPTGRAAQRMTESTGMPSTTIHRLLEYKPYEGDTQCKDAENPIEADFIIVDEASMLDLSLASLFLTAIKSGSLVIFVGDINQLQSVGTGDVLNDLIHSGVIPVERLIKTYRQAADSMIIKNALKINNGYYNLISGNDFEIITSSNITEDVARLVEQYHKADDPYYVQVLSPSHKNDGGVQEINTELQKRLNPNKSKAYVYGNTSFRVNDKIIMVSNNPTKGYCNGDTGVIKKIEDDKIKVVIQGQTIVLEKELIEDMKLSYSMTIHKSQGSEFPVVIIALPTSNMLQRNLLYTAVTRAKKKVIIVQNEGAIVTATRKSEVGKRHSMLIPRLRNEWGIEQN